MKELISIQQNLVATKSHRDQRGTFAYRTAEDILAAYKTLPEAQTCILVTDTEVIVKGEGERQKQYVVCVATLTNKEGKTASAKGFAEIPDKLAAMSLPQITGSCESYAKKRALGNLFLIEDSTSDPDSQVNVQADIKGIKNMLNEAAHYDEFYKIAQTYWSYIQADKSLYKVYTSKYNALKIAHPEEFPKEQ